MKIIFSEAWIRIDFHTHNIIIILMSLYGMSLCSIQHCYNHCKEKVLEQLVGRLNRVFSVEHDRESHKETLQDISMAYGLLLRAAPLQESTQCCDSLSEEVSYHYGQQGKYIAADLCTSLCTFVQCHVHTWLKSYYVFHPN